MIQKEFIRNELRYRYPELSDSIRALLQPVGRPLMFEGGTRKFGARIIICASEEMDELRGAGQSEPLFLCIGSPKPEVLNAYDTCVLPKGEQSGAVLNFVQRLFDRLDDWTQSLRQAAETGEGVEALLYRASEMLQNPVLLLDERGHVVAHSEQAETIARVEQFSFDKLLEDRSERAEKRGDTSAPEALFARVQSGDALFTLLCTASERPLYASDEIAFESLAGFLRLMLSERKLHLGTHRKLRENEAAVSAFRSLLLQDGAERSAIEALRRLGWSETNEYAVLAIEPINADLRAAQADLICDQLESALDGCCTFSLLPVVAAVVRAELLNSEALYNSLRHIAHSYELRIGICEAYAGYSFFPQRLEQAKRALNRAAEFGGAVRFSDIIDEAILQQTLGEFPGELICMRSVLALARYDRAHDSNYLETTEQYVRNRFNAVKTAGELFIHRSTLLYRLERIRAQFSLNLDESELSLLHLLFSLRVAKALSTVQT